MLIDSGVMLMKRMMGSSCSSLTKMAVDLMIRGNLICELFMMRSVSIRLLSSTDLGDSVSNITNDAATLTTYLAAQAVPWSDVAGSYELEFGHPVPVPQAHRLKRSVLEGNVNDTTTTFSFNISTGQPGQRTNIPTDAE